MSNSKKITPPGYNIVLSETDAAIIAEFVDTPAFKIIKNKMLQQREDILGRMVLKSAVDERHLYKFKGMAEEGVLFVKSLMDIKKAYYAAQESEDSPSRD